MKVTLLFLSTMMVISHQQHPVFNTVRLLHSPYLPHFMFRSYDSTVDQNYPEGRVNFRYKGPIHSSPYYAQQNANLNPVSLMGSSDQDNVEIDYVLDPQSRYSVGSFPEARLFFGLGNGATGTGTGSGSTIWGIPRTSVVVLTVTSAVVQTCVPSTQFNPSQPPNACRRKRSHDTFHLEEFDDVPFSVTKVQKVTPTELPTVDYVRENRQSSTELDSSKISSTKGSQARDRRSLFNLLLPISTSTSYVFSPTTIFKTVNLGDAGRVSCIPAGYVTCTK